MKKNKDCILCNREQIKEDIIGETKNFFVKVGVGIVSPGHVMIVTKEHYSCFGELSKILYTEFRELSNKLRSKLEKEFSDTFQIEYGVFYQTVPHAHIHFIPLKSNNPKYEIKDIIKEMVIPGNIKFEETDLDGLKRIYENEKGYVSISQNGKLYVCHINDSKLKETAPYVGYRDFFHKNKNLNEIPLKWREMNKEQRDEDNEKRRITKERLNGFLT